MQALTEIAEQLTHQKTLLRLTDRDILFPVLQPEDKDADFVSRDDNYIYWMLIGEQFQPHTIAEIGTRFGYSLWSLWFGAGHPRQYMKFWVTDNESDHYPTLDRFVSKFVELGFGPISLDRSDSQKLTSLKVPELADLSVVDGLHTEAGVFHDLGLARNATKPGGIIVCDDTQPGCVRDGCMRFVAEYGLEHADLPSYRGVTLIRV